MPHPLWYTRRMKNMKNNITEAQLLCNQQVKVTSPQSSFWGQTGIVNKVMADGRSLEVTLDNHGKVIIVDVTLVSEIQEPTQYAKTEQSLGPDANSVLPNNRL